MPRLFALALAAALTAASLPARAQQTIALRCDGNGGRAAMENSYLVTYLGGACWGHLGHHTYALGGLYRIGAVTGSVFSVEVQLSPPIELDPDVIVPVVVESSVDGLSWTTVHRMPYVLSLTRQRIDFSFDAGGAVARFLRVRQPRSIAQGLSGYLDSSRMDVSAEPEPGSLPGLPPSALGARLTCLDHVMERFFSEHPCTFGGINRWDAPSFFHTYPLGGAALERLAGAVVFAPWRTDDYFMAGGSRTDVAGLVEVSADGITWSAVATIAGKYGAPITFDLDLDGSTVSFVRLVAERHTAFPYTAGEEPLKHPRGMLAFSTVEITLPA